MRDPHKCLHLRYTSGFVVCIYAKNDQKEVTFTITCADCGMAGQFQGLGPEASIPFTMGNEAPQPKGKLQ